MISRRALLGSGAAVVVVAGGGAIAAAAHRLDDVARGFGITPRPRPVASDDTLIAKVAHEQNGLLALVEAIMARHDALTDGLHRYAKISQAQVKAVGGTDKVPDAPPVDADPARAVTALATSYAKAARARASDADRAVSPDLARVLSSMSAGLDQCARAMGDLR